MSHPATFTELVRLLENASYLSRLAGRLDELADAAPETGIERLATFAADFGLELKQYGPTAAVLDLRAQRGSGGWLMRVPLLQTSDIRLLAPVAAALALPLILQELPASSPARLRFLFEHEGGAAQMQRDALSEMTAVIGLSSSRDLPAGTVGVNAGIVFPEKIEFKLLLRQGPRQAGTNSGQDLIRSAAHVITGLGQSMGRRINPLTPVRLHLGSICSEGGAGANPATVIVTGWLQSAADPAQVEIPQLMFRILNGLCETYGLQHELVETARHPAVYADAKIAAKLSRAAEAALGRDRVIGLEYAGSQSDLLAGYLRSLPGAVLEMGIKNPPELPVVIAAAVKTLARLLFADPA